MNNSNFDYISYSMDLKFLPDIKRIQKVDFLDVNIWHKISDFADFVQQVATSVTFNMRHHALLVRGRVVVPCQLAVEPDAAAALISVAVAAQGCVVELEQLRIGDVQTLLQVAN